MTYIGYTQQASTNNTLSESCHDRPKSLQSLNDIKAVEICFEEHEIYVGDRAIAKIILVSEDFETQPWVVIINGIEIHRGNTWMKCFHFVTWHFTQGTLPEQQEEITAAETECTAIPVFIPQHKSKPFAMGKARSTTIATNIVQKVYAKCFDLLQLSFQHLLLLLKKLEKVSEKQSMRT